MNHLMMTGMKSLKKTAIMRATAGMTDTHGVIAKTDGKTAETGIIMIGIGPFLHMKKENTTPTPQTLPPGVEAL